MKRTSEDESFSTQFGTELTRHYERATQEGINGLKMSDEQFASTLDVTRPALKKYLNGLAMPALRVVVLAFLRYGINIPYFGMPLFSKRKQAKGSNLVMTQLVLPFSVQALNTVAIEAKIERKGPTRFELRVNLDKAI
jgi:hypothetical protein